MNLLIYSHAFAPAVGGIETSVQSLARGLAGRRDSRGQPELVVTLATRTPAGEFDDRALPFRVVRRPGPVQLARLIRASDVVHLAGAALMPLTLGLLAGKRVVVEHHGFQAICPNGQFFLEPAAAPCPGHFMAGHHAVCLRCNAGQGWFTTLKLWLLTFVRRFLCLHVACNITPTAWLGELVRLPRTVTIPHGLETAGPFVRIQTNPSQLPVVAFVGRLVSTKGVGVLLEAARILRAEKREFEVLLIGDGPEREALKRLAQEPLLARHVRFAGRLSGEEADAALARATLVVAPSLGGEVFGMVVAENMLRGLPVIASDLGSFVEAMADGGIIVPTGDAPALARAIARVLDEPALAAELSRRGRLRAEEFCDFQRMLESHIRVYQQTQS